MEILVNRNTDTVCFNTDFLTKEIDLSSMDPLIDVVLYDTETQTGTKFFGVAAKVDGYLRPEEEIDETEFRRLVGSIVDLAQLHWDAQRYPYLMYKTSVTEDQFNDGRYVGQLDYITTYPHPTSPPEGYTTIESPSPTNYDPLVQWTGTNWYRAPWKHDATIDGKKEDFTNYLLAKVAKLVDNQLRIYSFYDIIDSGRTLRPADSNEHGRLTMDDYITDLNSTIQSRLNSITAALNDDDLFALNFVVDDLF